MCGPPSLFSEVYVRGLEGVQWGLCVRETGLEREGKNEEREGGNAGGGGKERGETGTREFLTGSSSMVCADEQYTLNSKNSFLFFF